MPAEVCSAGDSTSSCSALSTLFQSLGWTVEAREQQRQVTGGGWRVRIQRQRPAIAGLGADPVPRPLRMCLRDGAPAERMVGIQLDRPPRVGIGHRKQCLRLIGRQGGKLRQRVRQRSIRRRITGIGLDRLLVGRTRPLQLCRRLLRRGVVAGHHQLHDLRVERDLRRDARLGGRARAPGLGRRQRTVADQPCTCRDHERGRGQPPRPPGIRSRVCPSTDLQVDRRTFVLDEVPIRVGARVRAPHFGFEAVACPRDGADDRRLGVQRLTNLAHCLGKGFRADRSAGPDSVRQFVR